MNSFNKKSATQSIARERENENIDFQTRRWTNRKTKKQIERLKQIKMNQSESPEQQDVQFNVIVWAIENKL